ncbi:MAG: isoaspartyl peptidase/L-asparaginase [Gammaproteobacteria bacterium]|nr:MAG: isoaspartyl peptidase/L-asparaginase [Gammaproteobacteria bacterium]
MAGAADAGFALALHGGASDLLTLSDSGRGRFATAAGDLLGAILAAGREALARGVAALDVVEAAVRAMEDSGVLNAGRGSTRNRDGEVQTDAAIMDGRTLRAGGVAAVRQLRNPVSAARLVMERSTHVLLAGADAERFATDLGAARVGADYFRLADAEHSPGDSDTVGAVARDRAGNLAAATSTGGIHGKLPGRVGDSPVIGAGTYADNASVAVSCTGQGEFFMRLVLAHELAALLRHRGLGLAEAASRAIGETLTRAGGRGGLIAVSSSGEVALQQNTAFMPRGFVTATASPVVLFGRDRNTGRD